MLKKTFNQTSNVKVFYFHSLAFFCCFPNGAEKRILILKKSIGTQINCIRTAGSIYIGANFPYFPISTFCIADCDRVSQKLRAHLPLKSLKGKPFFKDDPKTHLEIFRCLCDSMTLWKIEITTRET